MRRLSRVWCRAPNGCPIARGSRAVLGERIHVLETPNPCSVPKPEAPSHRGDAWWHSPVDITSTTSMGMSAPSAACTAMSCTQDVLLPIPWHQEPGKQRVGGGTSFYSCSPHALLPAQSPPLPHWSPSVLCPRGSVTALCSENVSCWSPSPIAGVEVLDSSSNICTSSSGSWGSELEGRCS